MSTGVRRVNCSLLRALRRWKCGAGGGGAILRIEDAITRLLQLQAKSAGRIAARSGIQDHTMPMTHNHASLVLGCLAALGTREAVKGVRLVQLTTRIRDSSLVLLYCCTVLKKNHKRGVGNATCMGFICVASNSSHRRR